MLLESEDEKCYLTLKPVPEGRRSKECWSKGGGSQGRRSKPRLPEGRLPEGRRPEGRWPKAFGLRPEGR